MSLADIFFAAVWRYHQKILFYLFRKLFRISKVVTILVFVFSGKFYARVYHIFWSIHCSKILLCGREVIMEIWHVKVGINQSLSIFLVFWRKVGIHSG